MGALFSKSKLKRIRTVEELRTLLCSVVDFTKYSDVTESHCQDIEALLANDNEEIARKSLQLIQQELMCGICRGLVKQAQINQWCGHFFCKTCILMWKDPTTTTTTPSSPTNCPICRMWLPDFMLVEFYEADFIVELVTEHSEIYKKEILEELEDIARITHNERQDH